MLVKHHPVREYNVPYWGRIFKCLIDEGFFAQTTCETVAEASALVHNDLVTHVHMTGGKKTHDAIVWGVGKEAEDNLARKTPKLRAKMTSELGCITPWIVVPDESWSDRDLEHHAKHVVEGTVSNNGCSNISPRLPLSLPPPLLPLPTPI